MRFVLSRWMVPLLRATVRSISKLLPITLSARILDVGCGRGALLRHLLVSLPLSVEPIGVDLTRSLLKLGVKESKFETRKVNLLEGTATRLPLKNLYFDGVFCTYMIKHLNDRDLEAVLLEVRRVLKPGGWIALWEFAPMPIAILDHLQSRILSLEVKAAYLRDNNTVRRLLVDTGFKPVDLKSGGRFVYPRHLEPI